MGKQNFLICLVGLPASGKSTLAFKLKEFIEQNVDKFKVKIIDPDKIRDEIAPDKFNPKKEQLVRKRYLEQIEKALKEGYGVISDDLNYYTSMRHDLKLIADGLNLNFFIVHVSTPLEICLEWNIQRGKPIPSSVIKKIHRKFDGFDKYRWDYPTARINLSEVKDFDATFNNLLNTFFYQAEKVYKKKKEKKVSPSPPQYNERLDTITRKIVSEVLKKQEFHIKKKKILACRKDFIRLYLDKSLDEPLLAQTFKKYLEKNLNIKIS